MTNGHSKPRAIKGHRGLRTLSCTPCLLSITHRNPLLGPVLLSSGFENSGNRKTDSVHAHVSAVPSSRSRRGWPGRPQDSHFQQESFWMAVASSAHTVETREVHLSPWPRPHLWGLLTLEHPCLGGNWGKLRQWPHPRWGPTDLQPLQVGNTCGYVNMNNLKD